MELNKKNGYVFSVNGHRMNNGVQELSGIKPEAALNRTFLLVMDAPDDVRMNEELSSIFYDHLADLSFMNLIPFKPFKRRRI